MTVMAWPTEPLEQQALQATLDNLDNGVPWPQARDGIVFINREARLPPERTGYYREYTVPTLGVTDRGARRIVTGAKGEIYYSADHYSTFVQVR